GGGEGGDGGPGEGGADDDQLTHTRALDGPPRAVRIETASLVGEDERAAAMEGVEGEPLSGAVHEGEHDDGAPAHAEGDVVPQLLLAVEPLEAREVAAEPVEEDVLVTPEDARREARRAAPVEDVEVVGRVGQVERSSRLARAELLVVECARKARVVRVVAQLDQVAELREPGAGLRDERGEGGLVDERPRPR